MSLKPGDSWISRGVFSMCLGVYAKEWPSTTIMPGTCDTALVMTSVPARQWAYHPNRTMNWRTVKDGATEQFMHEYSLEELERTVNTQRPR